MIIKIASKTDQDSIWFSMIEAKEIEVSYWTSIKEANSGWMEVGVDQDARFLNTKCGDWPFATKHRCASCLRDDYPVLRIHYWDQSGTKRALWVDSTVYILNDKGKTIETIREWKREGFPE